VGLNVINNVETNHPKTTENTTNTLKTFSQMENANGSKSKCNETATSKDESSGVSESEYVTDSDFEPATEDEIEITILDSDFEQKSKINEEKLSSLMEKVKEILSFARFILF
jgi:hypothetical protein